MIQEMIQKIKGYCLGGKRDMAKGSAVILLFVASFFAGRFAAQVTKEQAANQMAAPTVSEQGASAVNQAASSTVSGQEASAANQTASSAASEQEAVPASSEGSWGLSFQEEGKPPVANATREELAQYDAWYSQDTQEKIIYLTFDCGYENGNTPAILAVSYTHLTLPTIA